MKVDLVLLEHFDTLTRVSSAPPKEGLESGEFAALLAQALAADIKAGNKPGEAIMGFDLELPEEILSGEVAGEDGELSGEVKNGGEALPQTADNLLMLASEIESVVKEADMPLKTPGGEVTPLTAKQQGEAAMAKNPGAMFSEAVPEQSMPEKPLSAKPVVQSHFEDEAVKNKPSEVNLPEQSKAGELKAVMAETAPAQLKDVPGLKAVGEQAKASNADKAPAEPLNTRANPEAGFEKVVEQARAATAGKETPQPEIRQPVIGLPSDSDAAEKGSRFEVNANRQPVSQSGPEQSGIFQQPSVQGDDAVRAGSILQSQPAANLREAVLQQIEGRMVYLRETGTTPAEMRITLHPPELGEVTVRVFSKQGKLSASIIAETPLIKEILESSIAELRQRMNFVNIQFEQLDVSTSGNQSGGSDRSGTEHDQGRVEVDPAKSFAVPGEENEPILSHAPPDSTSRGIDYWA